MPLADKAFREDRIQEEWIDRRQFDEDLARGERAPDDLDRFMEVNLGYIEDVIDALAWARGSEDDALEESEEGDETSP